MIVEWFMGALSTVVSFVLSLFPSVPVASWVTDTSGFFSTLVSNAASMGVWIPWTLLLSVTGVVLACLLAGFTIKVVRIIASFVTLGGGSAA